MSTESQKELREFYETAKRTGMDMGLRSAISDLIKTTHTLEASPAQDNPEAARFISSFGNRLMNVGQMWGRPLVPPGVGDRPFDEGPAEE